MAGFYFHIRDGQSLTPDEEGMELSDLLAAHGRPGFSAGGDWRHVVWPRPIAFFFEAIRQLHIDLRWATSKAYEEALMSAADLAHQRTRSGFAIISWVGQNLFIEITNQSGRIVGRVAVPQERLV